MASKRQSQNGSTSQNGTPLNTSSNFKESLPLNNQQQPTHADHANNPTMPTNAPMPSSQPQQPIQQVHVPAHVYFHR